MKVGWLRRCLLVGLAVVLAESGMRVWAQASAIPSAQLPGTESPTAEVQKGKQLLDQMVAALGGELWLNRRDMVRQGRIATFYKGQPHPGAPGFEEYTRLQPFAQRIVLVAHFGDIIATDHRDVAELFTADAGYEITYKGTRPLPAVDVADFKRRHEHSLETIVQVWLKQKDVLVTYEGTEMMERRLADRVSVLTATNDGAVIDLDETTHLPLSIRFQWHDPLYQDMNTDVQEFEDYHVVQGIQTPYSITTLHNGDMTGQRFVNKVQYNTQLDPGLFDTQKALEKKGK